MQPVPGIQINIQNYEEKKAAGIVRIVKLNGRTHFAQKKFHEETGVPSPVLVQVERTDMVNALANLEKNMTSLKAIIADIDGAQEVL